MKIMAAAPFQAVLPRPSAATLDQDMPDELRQELDAVGKWATANKADAIRDRVAFWILKCPAILVSASAGVLAHFKLDELAMIAAGIASACVLIDGLRPRGLLFSIHSRASHDLFKMHADMLSEWRKGKLKGLATRRLAAEIIAKFAPARTRIAAYLAQAESSSLHSTTRPNRS
jgi:hypothetical protein